jgi:hypothetical protein
VGQPDETRVDSTAAISGASRLARVATDFETAWAEVRDRIAELHSLAPWGTDEVGQEFRRNYLPDDQTAGASGVMTNLSDLADALLSLGPEIIRAVSSSVEADEEIGRELRPQ